MTHSSDSIVRATGRNEANPIDESRRLLRDLTTAVRDLAAAERAPVRDEALILGLTARRDRLRDTARHHRRPLRRKDGVPAEAHVPDAPLVPDPQGSFTGLSFGGNPLRSWQIAALQAWERDNFRGVVEAVTGTGKSLVGIAAIHKTVVTDAGKALVLVPTVALLAQWVRSLRQYLPEVRVGQVGAGNHESLRNVDVLVATVQSASKAPPLPISLGLIVADEVHRYGSASYARALHTSYTRRLGLTATYERQADDGIEQFLAPYFGDISATYSYGQALAEKVVAPFGLALVGLGFTSTERRLFDRASDRCKDAMRQLQSRFGYADGWADFFARVTQTLKRDSSWDEETDWCAQYMAGFSERRRLTAEARAKTLFVRRLAPVLTDLGGTLVFTETKESAVALAEVVGSAVAVTSDVPTAQRQDRLRGFESGRIKVLCAPRVLDEGVDVPEAELAIVVATSATRRQMIQRMGRVIRLKKDGRSARIVMLYIRDTGEDPDTGGHEAFLDSVRPFAADEIRVDGDAVEQLERWLKASVPKNP